jgi:Bifunctional DNA primase/polymerase, N-terminal
VYAADCDEAAAIPSAMDAVSATRQWPQPVRAAAEEVGVELRSSGYSSEAELVAFVERIIQRRAAEVDVALREQAGLSFRDANGQLPPLLIKRRAGYQPGYEAFPRAGGTSEADHHRSYLWYCLCDEAEFLAWSHDEGWAGEARKAQRITALVVQRGSRPPRQPASPPTAPRRAVSRGASREQRPTRRSASRSRTRAGPTADDPSEPPKPGSGDSLETSSLLAAALYWASQGVAVLPCHTPHEGGCSCRRGPLCSRPGKHPCTRRGVDAATTDAARIRRWWRGRPGANLAIATGAGTGLIVVDLDGDEGAPSWGELTARHGRVPTFAVRTGGGGLHYYYRLPLDFGGRIGCPTTRLGLGVHIRCQGGYAIAPPSLHHTGATYRPANDMPVSDAPPWLLELLATAPHTAARPSLPIAVPTCVDEHPLAARWRRDDIERVRHAAEHTRNNTLFLRSLSVFGLVRGGYLDFQTTWGSFREAALEAGLSLDRVEPTLASAWRTAEPRRVWSPR